MEGAEDAADDDSEYPLTGVTLPCGRYEPENPARRGLPERSGRLHVTRDGVVREGHGNYFAKKQADPTIPENRKLRLQQSEAPLTNACS